VSGVLAVLTAALSLGGGGGGSEQDALREARQHWREQRARDYTYVVVRTCFCPSGEPIRIRVVDRRPRDTPATYDGVDTAKELFQVAGRAIRSEGSHTVRYRPRLGLPRLISADPIVNAVDDEFSHRITKLRITRRYPSNGGGT
jgi:hypothetical protein